MQPAQIKFGFQYQLTEAGMHQLTFPDLPNLTIQAPNRDALFSCAQAKLDDYLYALLKKGTKIAKPHYKTSQDKYLSPSEAVQMALGYYIL